MPVTDDALIATMARAMFKPDQVNRLDIAKAALAVARPIIERETRERCAKIAEGLNGWGSDFGKGGHAMHIAAAIRETGDE